MTTSTSKAFNASYFPSVIVTDANGDVQFCVGAYLGIDIARVGPLVSGDLPAPGSHA